MLGAGEVRDLLERHGLAARRSLGQNFVADPNTVAHIARAALESIAFQSAALLQAMSRDAVAAGAHPVSELRVDGGAHE